MTSISLVVPFSPYSANKGSWLIDDLNLILPLPFSPPLRNIVFLFNIILVSPNIFISQLKGSVNSRSFPRFPFLFFFPPGSPLPATNFW